MFSRTVWLRGSSSVQNCLIGKSYNYFAVVLYTVQYSITFSLFAKITVIMTFVLYIFVSKANKASLDNWLTPEGHRFRQGWQSTAICMFYTDN